MRRWAPVLLLAFGCGDPPFEPRSTVEGHRVLTMQASPPEATLADTVVVRAFEHVPPDVASVERTWSFCLFSLGGADDYACVDPELEVALEGDAPQVEVPLAMLLPGLFEKLEELGRTLFDNQGQDIDQNTGIPAYVRLKTVARSNEAGVEPKRAETVVRVLLTMRPARNRNPGVEGIRFGNRGVVVSAPIETELPIEVLPAADARETYVQLDTECYQDAVEGGTAPETANEACSERVTEALSYRWYTTGGELSRAVGFEAQTETVLTLPEEAGPLSLWVVVSDGRGGNSVVEHALEVTEPE